MVSAEYKISLLHSINQNTLFTFLDSFILKCSYFILVAVKKLKYYSNILQQRMDLSWIYMSDEKCKVFANRHKIKSLFELYFYLNEFISIIINGWIFVL